MLRSLSLCLFAALMLATPVFAADAMSSQDFVKKAAIGNMFEVKSSQLALKRSKNADVREFAKQMVADHGKAGGELKTAVADSKLKLMVPAKLDAKHAANYNKLAKSKKFDADYIAAQKKAHDDTVELFQSYADNGDNMALKNFATATLPTLKLHQDHVNMLSDKK